jgi:glycosyltransferase involved in cell wall biosynthesis/SAM-dependent methyltransferase
MTADVQCQPKVSVIIASYRRAESLVRCLASLIGQTRVPDEILVVYKEHDQNTRIAVEDSSIDHPNVPIKALSVKQNSVLAAENRGIAEASGDIFCFIDDDAEAHKDWIERILPHYENPTVGGVGGRDILVNLELPPHKKIRKVGVLTWYGKLYGGHHLGSDTPVDVNFLKGCNMSYRKSLIRPIDARLLGEIAFGFEMDIGLSIRELGYRLVYDPEILVDHHVVSTHSESRRKDNINPEVVFIANHNHTYLLLKYLQFPSNVIFLLYSGLVGADPVHSGLLLGLARFLMKRDHTNLILLYHALRGKIAGLRTYLTSRNNHTSSCSWACLCSSRNASLVLSGVYHRLGPPNYQFQILRCADCSLLRTHPKPSSIGCCCNDSDTHEGPSATDQFKDPVHLERAKWIASYISCGEVLDIGSDTGKFLEVMEGLGNYCGTGVETSKSAAEYGKSKGRRIHNSDLMKVGFPSQIFDVVTLFHVLEHIENIEGVLREIYRIMKPGGYLFVIVPNYKGLMARIRKEQWAGYFPQEHFWHFDRQTFTAYLTNDRLFEPIRITTRGSSEEFLSTGWKGMLVNVTFVLQKVLNRGGTIEGVFRKPRISRSA